MNKRARKICGSPLKRVLFKLSAIAWALAALFIGLSCQDSRKTYEGKPLSLIIGTPALETNALTYVAGGLGLFEKNGLRVTLKEYDSGGAAVPGLIKKEVDLAIASEFVMVNNILSGRSELRLLGSIDRFENMFLIARKDRKIGRVADLKKRKIGVPAGTIGSFYLGRYLTLHGLGPADAMMKDIRPDRSADALYDGDIDAVVTWHPYLEGIKERYGDRVTVWPIQSSQLTYWSIIARMEWIGTNRETIDRLMHSLAQAEKYATLHPEDARAMVKKRLGYGDAYLAEVWGDNQYSLSLDRALIAAMEDEARWMIRSNLTSEKQVPDFSNCVYQDGLKAVKPEAVNIIR